LKEQAMNDGALNFIELGRQSLAAAARQFYQNEMDILTNNISDEALEASSGIENLPMYLLPCTSAPCMASTFCSGKC
jgi:hypothetical protein